MKTALNKAIADLAEFYGAQGPEFPLEPDTATLAYMVADTKRAMGILTENGAPVTVNFDDTAEHQALLSKLKSGFNPIMNEMFCAEKGNGAYLNNSRIRVSNKKKIKDALLVTGGPKGISKIKNKIFSEYINVSLNVSNVRKFGSAALDIAYVACGRFDGYWQRELNYWDIAAGLIILKEAGGFVDFFEEDASLPLKKNILATNSNIHEELRDLVNKKDIE